ncbi:secreted effector protein PipB2 [Azospirillaceae bacterium]|nr:hypothetical protein MTCCP1_00042 [uncultured bacterium]
MFSPAKPTEFEYAQVMATLVRHRYWLKADARGVQGDLSFRNLSGMKLNDHQLQKFVFKGASLSGADLSKSDLSGADFFGADLENANFDGANLSGADFRGANLHRAILSNCKLQGADFRTTSGDDHATCLTEAKLSRSILCQANLSGCDMSGAELVDADLSGADISKVVMVGAELSGAVLTGVKLNGTVLELCRLSSSQQAQLGSIDGIAEPAYNALLPGIIVKLADKHAEWIDSGGKNGSRLDFDGVRISDVSLAGRNLAGARLRRCALNGIDLTGANFDMVDMAYSDLRNSNLELASLKGTTLRGANLARARMAGANLDPMILHGSRSWPTNLDGAILQAADLTNTSFANAIMYNADLRGSIIFGTNFSGVDLGKIKRSTLVKENADAHETTTTIWYSEPRMFVKTMHGVCPVVNWSFSGVCMSYQGEDRFIPDSIVSTKIVSMKHPPPSRCCLYSRQGRPSARNGLAEIFQYN